MAKKLVYVSDKSGETILDGQGAKVKITFADARRGSREADVTIQEAEHYAAEMNARNVARRGRPKTV